MKLFKDFWFLRSATLLVYIDTTSSSFWGSCVVFGSVLLVGPGESQDMYSFQQPDQFKAMYQL